MRRTVLVDGYNVIRRDPALARLEHTSLELARDTLLSCVNSSRQFRDAEVTVVFDGANSAAAGVTGSRAFRRGRVRVIFSPPGRSADDVIRTLAAQAPPGALVITDDREIRDAVQRAGQDTANLAPRAAPRPAPAPRPRPNGTWLKEDDLAPDRAAPKKGNGRRAPRKRNRRPTDLSW